MLFRSVYSFQAVKNLPTADSGMICFHNKKYDEICRKLTWLGINKDTYARNSGTKGSYKWKYDVEYLGYKDHGNSIMAAIGLCPRDGGKQTAEPVPAADERQHRPVCGLEKNKSFFKYILLFLKKLKTILKYSIV